MEREGKMLKVIAKGDRRRISDFKNAWRKMVPEQRVMAMRWITAGSAVELDETEIEDIASTWEDPS